MTLFEVIVLVWRRRSVVLLVTLIFVAAAVAAAFVIRPVYRAEVLLVPVAREGAGNTLASLVGGLGGLASLAGVSVGANDQTSEAIAVLRSRSLAAQFIEDNGLLAVLFSDRWDAERSEWKSKPPTMGDALKLFDQVRTVQRDLDSGLVTLRIEWRDPLLATQWAEDLVRRANELLRGRAIQEADKSLEYLTRALSSANNVELRSAIATVMENQLQSRTFASVREDFAFRVVDPAVPPDLDKPVRPKRLVMVVIGAFAGVLAGVMLAAFLEYLRSARRARSGT